MRMAEKTLITSNRLRSSKERLITGTTGHELVNKTQFFEATSTGSFQGVRISSVASRWSCSKTDKSNCCSHETLFHETTCGFKRRDAVNYPLISGAGKHLLPLIAAGCCAAIGEDWRARTKWRPLNRAGSLVILSRVSASIWKYYTTPTRRDHGRTLIRPSFPACAILRMKE